MTDPKPEPCSRCKGRKYLRKLDASGNWDESEPCQFCMPHLDQGEPMTLISTADLADLEAKHAHLETVLDQSRTHVDELEAKLEESEMLCRLADGVAAQRLEIARRLKEELKAAERERDKAVAQRDAALRAGGIANESHQKAALERDEAQGRLAALVGAVLVSDLPSNDPAYRLATNEGSDSGTQE